MAGSYPPDLAGLLVGTGDARIDHRTSPAYRGSGPGGRNRLARRLELIRPDLVAERAGFRP